MAKPPMLGLRIDRVGSECTIFLGYTPNNAISLQSIVGLFPKTDNYFFLSCDRCVVRNLSGVGWLGVNAKNQFLKVISFLVTSVQLRWLMYRYNEVSICLPHPDHLVGNFLFNSDRVKRRYIIEDGLLNYYDAVITAPLSKRMRLRSWLGYFLGLPYKAYSGFISGIDVREYDGAFITHPEKMVRPEAYGKIKKISRYQRSWYEGQLENTILFLDQNFEGVISKDKAARVRAEIDRVMRDVGGKVITKLHYNMKSDEVGDEVNQLSPDQQYLPAECLVEVIRPKVVVSFISSALINIKNMYPEIRCISVGSNLHEVSINGVLFETSELLQSFDIEVVGV